MTMHSLTTRVTLDAGMFAIALALGGAWLGGRTMLLGILGGALLALADFWWLAARLDGVSSETPGALAWIGAAGLRLGGVAIAVALLFVTGWFHPVGLVAGLAVLPCALVARGLRLARRGA
ncbi:MAG: hypothetical protein FJZ38_10610 [Candidatus Rokubacteria bacterium]|nr:hypothetical protein [Candidatus Rokubacteria bacterium]